MFQISRASCGWCSSSALSVEEGKAFGSGWKCRSASLEAALNGVVFSKRQSPPPYSAACAPADEHTADIAAVDCNMKCFPDQLQTPAFEAPGTYQKWHSISVLWLPPPHTPSSFWTQDAQLHSTQCAGNIHYLYVKHILLPDQLSIL